MHEACANGANFKVQLNAPSQLITMDDQASYEPKVLLLSV